MLRQPVKGKRGYIFKKRKREIIWTICLFALPLLIFFTGLISTGSRLNLFTVVAVLGCLPACKALVGVIMICLRKKPDIEAQDKIETCIHHLTHAYDLTITAYEKTTPLESIVVCGNTVIGYSGDSKTDIIYIQQHIQDILKINGYKTNVKVFKELKPYLERIKQLETVRDEMERKISFQPDSRYPDLTRSELILHTILAISL